MNNIIYIGASNVSTDYHVGMTANNRSPLMRWQDGDYRGKMIYVPRKVEFYHVGNLRDEPIHEYIIKDPHVTKLKDIIDIRSDEVFRVEGVDNPEQYLKNLVEEAIAFNKTGIRPVDRFYVARPHQESVNRQILDKWTGEVTVIQPLDLCARFGKDLQKLSLFIS